MKKNSLLIMLLLPLIIGCGPKNNPSRNTSNDTPTEFVYSLEKSVFENYQSFNQYQETLLVNKSQLTSNVAISDLTNMYFKNKADFIISLQEDLNNNEERKAQFIEDIGEEEVTYLLNVDTSKMFINLQYHDVDKDKITSNVSNILDAISNKESTSLFFGKIDTFFDDYREVIEMNRLINIYADLFIDNEDYQVKKDELDILYNNLLNDYKKMFQGLLSDDAYVDKAVEYFELTKEDVEFFLSTKVYEDDVMKLFDEETTLENSFSDTLKIPARNELYLQLVNQRKKIATRLGYDNYLEYVYSDVYDRSYSIDDSRALLDNILKYFPKIYYKAMNSLINSSSYLTKITELDLLKSFDFAVNICPQAEQSIRDLKMYGYYNFDNRTNKYSGSYQTTLDANEEKNYIFISTNGDIADYPTVFHELGHYLASEVYDETKVGDKFDLDIAEVDSQGLEYLMGNYFHLFMDDYDAKQLNKIQISNALWTIMSGSTIASFEDYIYTSEEELTLDSIQAKFNEIADSYIYPYSFGYDAFTGDYYYSVVPHIFSSPGYYISYVNSIIPSLLLWANPDLEEAKNQYNTIVSYGTTNDFVYVLNQANLKSPFEESVIVDIYNKMSGLF
ncbi:MAG: hypothetical protein PUA56_04700 [Bacillales bacterium]|nr:hypothetical protein [Bacillales bacterium]